MEELVRLPMTRESGADVDISFKVIIVGDTGVGKTCLLRRFAYDDFDETHSVTIGGDFINIYHLIGGKKTKMQLWDTCGLEQYRSLVRFYFKGAHAAIITYAMNESSEKSIRGWHREIRENAEGGIPIYLVGTKLDLNERMISPTEVLALVDELGLEKHFGTSAKTKVGINEMMHDLLLTMYEKETNKTKVQQPDKFNLQSRSHKQTSCC
eukprot:TRINITY_DN7283_c0_g2_i1.p2 TRINITY_DN7283_c0_g2~~TRINITY_DN7283_c0_g2_i1.p2  ORF type:complete len:210 (+),score=60.82 TRINITY_DN7283_c0_g2_i1:129-758(+)